MATTMYQQTKLHHQATNSCNYKKKKLPATTVIKTMNPVTAGCKIVTETASMGIMSLLK
jgi:hypothetical protein